MFKRLPEIKSLTALTINLLRAELGHEDVAVADARERASDEVDGFLKVSRHKDIARAVHRNARSPSYGTPSAASSDSNR